MNDTADKLNTIISTLQSHRTGDQFGFKSIIQFLNSVKRFEFSAILYKWRAS